LISSNTFFAEHEHTQNLKIIYILCLNIDACHKEKMLWIIGLLFNLLTTINNEIVVILFDIKYMPSGGWRNVSLYIFIDIF